MANAYLGTQNTATGGVWKHFGITLMSGVLEGYYPRLVLHDMGSHVTLQGHRGKQVYQSQWVVKDPVEELTIEDGYTNPSATTEDSSPDSVKMEMKNYTGTIQAFGGSFGYTDTHANITQVTGELVEGARQLGSSYGRKVTDNTLKKIYTAVDAADSTTAKTLGADGSTWSTATKSSYMTLTDISIVRAFFESDATAFVPAWPDGTYKAIIHPNVRHDLFVDAAAVTSGASLIQWLQSSRGQGMYRGTKLPMIHDIVFEISAFDTTDPFNSHAAFVDTNTDLTDQPFDSGSTGTATGYISLFFAPGAFANLSLANATPSLIIQPFGSAGTNDSLKRKMTVGIKGYQTCMLQDMAKRCVLMATGSSLVA